MLVSGGYFNPGLAKWGHKLFGHATCLKGSWRLILELEPKFCHRANLFADDSSLSTSIRAVTASSGCRIDEEGL